MAQSQTIQVQARTKLGSRDARSLRSAGRIPANIQSDGTSPHIDFSLVESEFLAARRHHVHLYDLDFGGNVESAVVRELQWDNFGESIIHIEFKRVRADEETESEVELEFVGQPKKGMVNHLVTHISIYSLPSLIPDSIEVRVGELVEGQHIRASDLVLPAGVRLGIPPQTEIAVITSTREADLEASPITEPGEVEIIGEKKEPKEKE